jgi:hypothetical protein
LIRLVEGEGERFHRRAGGPIAFYMFHTFADDNPVD